MQSMLKEEQREAGQDDVRLCDSIIIDMHNSNAQNKERLKKQKYVENSFEVTNNAFVNSHYQPSLRPYKVLCTTVLYCTKWVLIHYQAVPQPPTPGVALVWAAK